MAGEPEEQASERRRCPQHGLALDPSGRCLRCAGPAVETKQPNRTFVVVAALLLVITAGSVLAHVAGRRRIEPAPPETPSPPVSKPEVAQAPPTPVAEVSPPPIRLTRRAAPAATLPSVATVQAAVPPAQSPAPPLPSKIDEEAETRERHRRINERARAREVAARGSIGLTMYSASWCGACRSARRWLDEQQISYTEHDIDKDPEARGRQRTLNPSGSVPTIEVGGEVLVGFSPARLRAAIDRAANPR
jgi:glutaredoxin